MISNLCCHDVLRAAEQHGHHGQHGHPEELRHGHHGEDILRIVCKLSRSFVDIVILGTIWHKVLSTIPETEQDTITIQQQAEAGVEHQQVRIRGEDVA